MCVSTLFVTSIATHFVKIYTHCEGGMHVSNTIGDRLRLLRDERGLTQAQIANIFSVPTSRYSNYENSIRTPDHKFLSDFADEFNTTVDYLIGRTDIRHPHVPDWYVKKHGDIPEEDMAEYLEYMRATVIDQVRALFANGHFAEVDREAIFRDVSDIYWKDKDNKNK